MAIEYDGCYIMRKSIPEFASGRWELLSCQFTGGRNRHKSSVSSYAISYRKPEAEIVREELLAKVYVKHPEGVLKAYEAMHKLWAGGFGPPSQFRVPKPCGFSLEPHVLFMEKAPGRPWSELILGSPENLRDSSERAADWLFNLHDSRLDFEYEPDGKIVPNLQRLSAKLVLLVPHLAPRIQAIISEINRALPYRGSLKPSHGDFRSTHVLVSPELIWGVDFDSIAMREPAFDVGYAVGQLITKARSVAGSYDIGAKAGSIFLRRYLSRDGTDLARVRLHIGRTVFQKAAPGVKRVEPGIEVESWLDLVERFLDAGAAMPLLMV